MVQIFDLHCIHGLPYTSPIKDYGTFTENSYNIHTEKSSDKSSVYIASDPAGAQIFINGIEQTGFRTPAMITDLPSGYNNLKLISPGYIDIESSFPVEPGRTYNVFLTMERVQVQTSIGSTGIVILLALGLGFLLLRNQKII